jgi:hypothetical protein
VFWRRCFDVGSFRCFGVDVLAFGRRCFGVDVLRRCFGIRVLCFDIRVLYFSVGVFT